jgi:hypothetical protein
MGLSDKNDESRDAAPIINWRAPIVPAADITIVGLSSLPSLEPAVDRRHRPGTGRDCLLGLDAVLAWHELTACGGARRARAWVRAMRERTSATDRRSRKVGANQHRATPLRVVASRVCKSPAGRCGSDPCWGLMWRIRLDAPRQGQGRGCFPRHSDR